MDKKNKNFNNSPIGYEIPQMDDNDVGLRSFEKKFQGSDFVSPLFGHNVKDIVTGTKSDIDIDVTSNYDSIREKGEKQISEEEILRKHGTLYPEFDSVESQMEGNGFTPYEKPAPTQTYNTPTPQPKVEEEVKISFDINPKEEPEVSVGFNNVSFETPKEDYSSKEAKLPPFFFQNTKPVEQEETVEEIKEEYSHTEEVKIEQPCNNIEEETFIPNNTVEYKAKPKTKYNFPPLSLFSEPTRTQEETPDFIEENKEIINNTLSEFNINGEVCNWTYGPTVTRYEIKLAPGVNVKKVPSIVDTIKMNLGAKTIRIEAPIPGKTYVGIEVPNRKAQMVHFVDIIKDRKFQDSKKALLFGLGKDIDGASIYSDITEMPHGLVGGATNSGKSVCINTLLVSLLIKNSPDDLKLILIDPKKVELSSYNDIPHLVTPVIDDAKMASQALKWAVDEMERRYTVFTTLKVRNIEGYNQKADPSTPYDKLPFLVIVIDELADLMSSCAADVEDSIQRLAQKARAAGIHLIVATQRPTTDVVKGTIKANIPTRIAFRVSQYVDSNTILDQGGAENLLGKGDMLLKTAEGITRIQGAYINGDDIDRITDYIRNNNECNYVFTHDLLKTPETQAKGGSSSEDEDELLYSAASFFIQKQSCSINALQQQFNFGFNRAQKIVEQLEKRGIVSARTGTMSREVLVTQYELDAMFNVQ